MAPDYRPDDDALRRILDEKKKADKTASGLAKVWSWTALLGGPTVNGLIAPAVAEQTSFFGVFFATLAFSLGVAAFCFIVMTKVLGDMGGIQYAMVGAACLFVGSVVAIWVGYGFYDEPVPYGKYGSTPFGWVLPFLEAAVATFGPFGAVLGAVSGFFAGRWGAIAYKAA